MSLLTLAMIVKDEAASLEGVLAHHRGLCDRAVIVDTGSRDGTPDLARAAGATVLDHEWGDDYSAARNAGLDAVESGWIVMLDADERIAESDFPSIRAAIGGPAAAYLQETRNYLPHEDHWEWQPVRGSHPLEEAGQTGYFVARRVGVFPARSDVRFSGRVHESVLPSVEAAGLPLRGLDAPVHHYGHVRGERIDEARRRRYADLVERKLNAAPDDPAALLEAASLHLEGGDEDRARRLLERLDTLGGDGRAVARGRFVLARLHRMAGRDDQAAELLASACTADPGLLFGWLERARVAGASGRWNDVLNVLQQAEAVFGEDEPLLMRERLFTLIRLRRLSAARNLAARVVRICPAWSDIAGLSAKLETMARDD